MKAPLYLSCLALGVHAGVVSPAVLAGGHLLEKRQHDHAAPKSPGGLLSGLSGGLPNLLSGLMSASMKTTKILKTQNLEPKFRKEAKRMILTWGPYKLTPPKPNAPKVPFFDAGTTMWTDILDGIPKDATYLWSNSSIVYADGKDATIDSGVYLHHYGIFDMDKTTKRVSSCMGILTPTRPSLFTGGVEDKGDSWYTSPDGKFNSGFYVGAKDKMMSTAQVVNYSNKTQEVYAKLEIEFVPGRVKDSLDVGIQSMSVTGCGMNIAITPKKDAKIMNLKSRIFPVVEDGYIIGATGHLHDGGVNLVVKVNGKVNCDSKAIYGGTAATAKMEDGRVWETINQMTRCIAPFPIKKGDNITVEANYDYVKHPSRKQNGGMSDAEQMGIAFMAFGWKP